MAYKGSGYNKNNKSNRNDNPIINVRAPYNFVSLPEHVIEKQRKDIPKQNQMPGYKGEKTVGNADLMSGYITYTMEALTDIIVGGYDGELFYKNVNGDYAIPGSTVRGLVRNNMQILSLSSIAPDVDGDYLMMYRKVAGEDARIRKQYSGILGSGTMKRDGKTVSLRKKVECGMLYFDGTHYWIIPSENKSFGGEQGRQNYYILRETNIIGDVVKNGKNSQYYYLVEKNSLMHQHQRYPFNGPRGKADRFSNNKSFAPSYFEIAYKLGPNQTITAVDDVKYAGEGSWCRGYFVSSGYMNNKKTHYIVPCENVVSEHSAGAYQLDEKEIKAYTMDYEGRKNTLGTTQGGGKKVKEAYQDYNRLPDKKGDARPVFYIESEGPDKKKFYYFGFTPNLRLFYKHTIGDAIPKSNIVPVDYTRAIMGYSTDQESQKSRVSFEEAVITNAAKEKAMQVLTLGGPKPTSYMDYLAQNGKDMLNYDDNDIKIRGYKQYWLHDEAEEANLVDEKKAHQTSFKPLQKGCSFTGKIRFHNLSKDELGLLLWSIRLEENSQQNIGKAKAHGYGRITMNIDDMKIYDYEKMYNSLLLDFEPYVQSENDMKEEVDSYVDFYQDYVKKEYGIDLKATTSIQRFFLMKDYQNKPTESKIDYMNVSREYSKRTTALPYPENVVGSKLNETKSVMKATKTTTNSSQKEDDLGKDVVKGIINNPLYDKQKQVRGVFVTLPGKNGNGLLHISQMKNPVESYLKKGQDILVKIIKVEARGTKNQYSLTDKDL